MISWPSHPPNLLRCGCSLPHQHGLAGDVLGPVVQRVWYGFLRSEGETFLSVAKRRGRKKKTKKKNREQRRAHAPKPQETIPQSHPSATDAFSISGVLIP